MKNKENRNKQTLAEIAGQLLEETRNTLATCTLEEVEALRTALEEPWAEAQKKEAALIEALKEKFRKAGATEAQFAWGTFTNVPLGFKAQRRVLRICREQDKLHEEALPLMVLAAAANERAAELG